MLDVGGAVHVLSSCNKGHVISVLNKKEITTVTLYLISMDDEKQRRKDIFLRNTCVQDERQKSSFLCGLLGSVPY